MYYLQLFQFCCMSSFIPYNSCKSNYENPYNTCKLEFNFFHSLTLTLFRTRFAYEVSGSLKDLKILCLLNGIIVNTNEKQKTNTRVYFCQSY